MHAANDFDPQDQGEEEFFEFDFTSILATGETIASVVWSCVAVNGSDAAAASRVTNVTFTQTTTAAFVSGLVGAVTYELRAMATTSAGQVLSLWAHVICQIPN